MAEAARAGEPEGLVVVAEGVETAGTWAQLASLGCDLAQGHYLSRPLAPDELDTWLAGSRTRIPTSS